MFNVNKFSQQNPVVENALSLDNSFKNLDMQRHSFFIEAVDFCESIDRSMLLENRKFYRTLLESGDNPDIIHESFSEWTSWIKNVIKKVIDFLKAILNKFWIAINMLIKREGYLKAHDKDLSKFNDDHKFYMKVFNFTLNVNCPATEILDKYAAIDKNDFSGTEIGKLLGTDNRNLKDIETAYDKYMDSLDDDEYDRIRALVMGKTDNERISASEYAKELFEIFRDGTSEKEEKQIGRTEVFQAQTYFKEYETLKKNLEKKRNEIEKAYNRISKAVDKLTKLDGTKLRFNSDINVSNDKTISGEINFGKNNSDVASKYDMFIKAIANEIHEVSNIHTMAFTAALDAHKDCFNQSKTIMYKALYRILGNIRTGVREETDYYEESWKSGEKDIKSHQSKSFPARQGPDLNEKAGAAHRWHASEEEKKRTLKHATDYNKAVGKSTNKDDIVFDGMVKNGHRGWLDHSRGKYHTNYLPKRQEGANPRIRTHKPPTPGTHHEFAVNKNITDRGRYFALIQEAAKKKSMKKASTKDKKEDSEFVRPRSYQIGLININKSME